MKVGGKIALGAAGLAGLTVFSLMLLRKRTFAKPVSFSENDYPVRIQKLPISSAGHRLYGELLLPDDGRATHPTVICSHGFNGSYRYFRECAGMCLARSGYAVYCFDFYGGSRFGKSGGKTTEMNVFFEREQLDGVIEYIKNQPFCDRDNLFLWGESQGGFVTAITAARHTEDVRAVALFYPAFCLEDDVLKKYRSYDELPEIINNMGVTISRKYYEGLFGYDAYAEAGKYTGPVLIVHGDADRTVNVSYGYRARDAYGNARLEILPGEDHGFSPRGKLTAAKMVYDFFEKERST